MSVTTLDQTQVRSIVLEAKLTKSAPHRIDAASAKTLYKMLLDGQYQLDRHAEPFRESLQQALRTRGETNIEYGSEARVQVYVRCEDCASPLFRTVRGPHVKGTVYECECGTEWRPRSLKMEAESARIAREANA